MYPNDVMEFNIAKLWTSLGGCRMQVDICEAGLVTPAGRIYSHEILSSQCERLRETMEKRGFMGELDPEPGNSFIRFNNVSHLVTDMWMEDGILKAEIEVLQTPSGRTLNQFIDRHLPVSFKMCGVGGGRVDDNGVLWLGENYNLVQIAAYTGPVCESHKKLRYRSIDDPWILSE
jgi:hypothetical protein